MLSIDSKLLMSYSIIIFMLVIGYLFVINGRVKTTVFDKRSGLLTEAKYPLSYYLSCGKNLSNSKVKTFRLRDIKAVRAAQRGINRGSVKEIAETGVDLISSGALTHSAPILDLGLDIEIG